MRLLHVVSEFRKSTSQNICPRITSNQIFKNRAKTGQNTSFVFLAGSAAKFLKRDISSASEKAFLGFWAIFLVARLPPKKIF